MKTTDRAEIPSLDEDEIIQPGALKVTVLTTILVPTLAAVSAALGAPKFASAEDVEVKVVIAGGIYLVIAVAALSVGLIVIADMRSRAQVVAANLALRAPVPAAVETDQAEPEQAKTAMAAQAAAEERAKAALLAQGAAEQQAKTAHLAQTVAEEQTKHALLAHGLAEQQAKTAQLAETVAEERAQLAEEARVDLADKLHKAEAELEELRKGGP